MLELDQGVIFKNVNLLTNPDFTKKTTTPTATIKNNIQKILDIILLLYNDIHQFFGNVNYPARVLAAEQRSYFLVV